MRNGIEGHGSYHDLNLHWDCASKLGGSLVGKDGVSEPPSLQLTPYYAVTGVAHLVSLLLNSCHF